MTALRTIASIDAKIRQREAVVLTVEEVKARVQAEGVAAVAAAVDVVVTGTFEPVESIGASINLGHTDPPINIRQCWIENIPAYPSLGAVDLFLGATAIPDSSDGQGEDRMAPQRGGGHAIADLIAGKPLSLRALGHVSDCYPRASFDTTISRSTINQFYLYAPRCLYQNFIVGVNAGDRPLYTYLGPLQPALGNAVYSNSGALSPLLNDPDLQAIGVGSRIFLGGAIAHVVGEGTQHFPLQKRLPNRTPIGPAATLSVLGDAKRMDARWVRGCYFPRYGPSLMVGIGVPLPVLNEEVVARCAVRDEDIVAPVVDFSIPRRVRPTFGLVNYAQLKSGEIEIEGQKVRTAPLVSIPMSRQVMEELRRWILDGRFTLSEPVSPIPMDRTFLPQDRLGSQIALE